MTIHRLSARSPFLTVMLHVADDGPHYYRGLVDTGASMTGVHPRVIERHRPMSLGKVDITQVGDDPLIPRYAETFLVVMSFGSTLDPSAKVGVEVVEAIPASDCEIIIGRDLISQWIMTLDGPADHLVIAI